MLSTDVINAMAERLAKTGSWRLRQELCTLTETMSREVSPVDLQVEERRFRDAADGTLAAYYSAKQLVALLDREFPQIADIEDLPELTNNKEMGIRGRGRHIHRGTTPVHGLD